MRRVILVVAAAAALSGCASFSMDSFKPAPVPVSIQLESIPPGADAVTSAGPGCKTPCSVAVQAAGTLSVTYTLPKYQPMTVPVTITQVPGDFTTPASTAIDPNPVIAELQPAVPVRRQRRPVKKRAATAAPAAVQAPAAASPFPAPR